MRFTGTAETKGNDILPALDYYRQAMLASPRGQSQRAGSSTIILFSEGIALKSKLSRLFTAGNLADLIRRSISCQPKSETVFGSAGYSSSAKPIMKMSSAHT